MSMTHFVKDLRGSSYGMLIVQGATRMETEWFHGTPLEAIQEHSEHPIGGLLRIEAHVRNELEMSCDRIEGFWDVPVQVFISDSMLDGQTEVVIRDLLFAIARMVEEDRDYLRDLWATQRLRWDAPEDPSELPQPIAEPNGEEITHKDVDGD